jgi:hypothetical protein
VHQVKKAVLWNVAPYRLVGIETLAILQVTFLIPATFIPIAAETSDLSIQKVFYRWQHELP